MSKIKGAAGLLVGIGGSVLFAVIAICLVVGYSHQHVHDRSADILNDHQAIIHVHDYHHSGTGIAATAAVAGLVWVVIAVVLILAGGAMYEARYRKWD